jgi:hypothetical protein
MEKETWDNMSRATEMENAVTYILKYTKKGHSVST